MNDLFPKPKRTWQLKQPRKNDLRWRMELAEAQLAYLRAPLWLRAWRQITARIRLPRRQPPSHQGG